MKICAFEGCGRVLAKDNKSGYCKDCRKNRVFVELPCANPDCKLTRTVTYEYSVHAGNLDRLCPHCCSLQGNASRKNATKIIHASSVVTKININGCTLVRTKSGRCKDFAQCRNGSHANLYGIPRKQDCCFRVGLVNWPGWRCVKYQPDIVPELEEARLFQKSMASNASLCLEA